MNYLIIKVYNFLVTLWFPKSGIINVRKNKITYISWKICCLMAPRYRKSLQIIEEKLK